MFRSNRVLAQGFPRGPDPGSIAQVGQGDLAAAGPSMMGCGFLVLIAYGAWRALR